jgi:hypothetical protein
MAGRILMQAQFPLTVTFLDDGEVVDLANEREAAAHLEWFDSDAPDQNAIVVDTNGRRVRLKIEKYEVLTCEVVEGPD